VVNFTAFMIAKNKAINEVLANKQKKT